MGAIEMRFLHQVRGPGVQPSWYLSRGQVGLLRQLPEANGEQEGEDLGLSLSLLGSSCDIFDICGKVESSLSLPICYLGRY